MMKMLRSAVLTVSVLALAACGDPDTNDPRGYTKAPLETPGWTIEGEEPTGMAELGDPIRVPSMDTVAAEPAPAATPATTAPAAATTPAPAAQ